MIQVALTCYSGSTDTCDALVNIPAARLQKESLKCITLQGITLIMFTEN